MHITIPKSQTSPLHCIYIHELENLSTKPQEYFVQQLYYKVKQSWKQLNPKITEKREDDEPHIIHDSGNPPSFIINSPLNKKFQTKFYAPLSKSKKTIVTFEFDLFDREPVWRTHVDNNEPIQLGISLTFKDKKNHQFKARTIDDLTYEKILPEQPPYSKRKHNINWLIPNATPRIYELLWDDAIRQL